MPNEEKSRESINVLLIEDNLDDAEFLEEHLLSIKTRKFSFKSCGTLEAGLLLLSTEEIDVVFLDLSLPDSSGLDTLLTLRRQFYTVPIVVLTGLDDDELSLGALKMGAQDYLVKGQIEPASLGRSINYAIERQRSADMALWLEAVVACSNDAIIGKNQENFVTSWNKAAERIYGYSSSEIVGKSIEILLPPDRENESKDILERIKMGERIDQYETTRIGKQGNEIQVSLSAAAIRNSFGILTGVSVIARDITSQKHTEQKLKEVDERFDRERKFREQALRDSEERLRLALESAHMAVWDWDVKEDKVWRSVSHDQIFGYESLLSEWSLATFLDHVIPEDQDSVKLSVQAALATGNFQSQCRIIHQSGELKWIAANGQALFDEHGRATRIMGAIRDVSEEKRLEQIAYEAERRREQISNAIVKHAPIGIAILDSDLFFTTVNSALISMSRRKPEQFLKQNLATFLPDDEVLKQARKAVISGKPFQLSRYPISVQGDESELHSFWDLFLWPVSSDLGILIGAVLQAVNTTETVLLERQRDDFVASVAHDIKNPLISADRILEELCHGSGDRSPEEHASILSVLREGNQNLLLLVQNLVDVYKYETLTYPCYFESTDLKILLASCANQISNLAKSRRVSIEANLPDELIAELDSVGLRRVIMNLLHNAVKFNKDGGSIKITALAQHGLVELQIADTGCGISESEQANLFQRYSQGLQGKRFTSGTGLGLYLSRQVIEAHNGTVSCDSKLNQGSVFTIKLPVSQSVRGAGQD